MFRPVVAILFLLLVARVGPTRPASLWATELSEVAGRTVEQYVAELDSGDRVVARRAIKSLGAFGAAAGEANRQALDHDDPAVRYIAAVNLGRAGDRPLENSIERLCQLAADESSLAVRLAASFALCRNGLTDDHLPLLIETLEYPERGMACSAATLIGMIGPQAKAAIAPLEAVHQKHRPGVKGGDYHIGNAAMNALRSVRPSED